jgi:predicted transcriptional regulator
VKGLRIRDVAIHGYSGLSADLTVKEAAAILANNFNRYFMLTDSSRPVATINRMDIISALAEKKYDTKLKHLLHHEVISFDGNDDLASVLDVLARHETTNYPVTVNGQISGVVNFNQVIEYILLHSTGGEAYSRVSSLAHLLSY